MSDASFLDFVLEQLAGAKPLKVRRMFGGHGRAALLRAPVQGSKRSFERAYKEVCPGPRAERDA